MMARIIRTFSKPEWTDLRVWLLIIFLAVVFFFKEWLEAGRGIIGGDVANYAYPANTYLWASIKQGRIPLWNPYVFSGMPFAADFQASILYPLNLLLGIVSYEFASVIIQLGDLIIAGLGMYYFMRLSDVSVRGALFSSVAFMFSGYLTVHLGPFSNFLLHTAVWLPTVLAMMARCSRRAGLSSIIGTALVVGMLWLVGFPTWIYFIALVSGFYLIFLTCREYMRHQRNWYLPLLIGGSGWILGTILAAIQLFPMVELIRLSDRIGIGAEMSATRSFPPQNLLTFFIPDLFGSSATHNAMQGSNYTETAAYVGILTLVLAGLALLPRWVRRPPAVIWLASLIVLATLVSLGTYTPFYGVLVALVPGSSLAGDPYRAIFLAAFGLAALAGFGIDRLTEEGAATTHTRVLKWLGLASCLAWAIVLVFILAQPFYMSLGPRLIQQAYVDSASRIAKLSSLYDLQLFGLIVFAVFLALGTMSIWLHHRSGRLQARAFFWVCLVLLLADLWTFGLKFVWVVDRVPAPTLPTCIRETLTNDPSARILPIGSAIEQMGGPNAGMVLHVPSISGYDPLILRDYKHLLAAIENVPVNQLDSRAPRLQNYGSLLLSLLNVKFIVAPAGTTQEMIPEATCGGLELVKTKSKSAPAWVAERVVRSTSEEIWQAMQSPEFSPYTIAYLEDGASLPDNRQLNKGTVDLQRYKPEALEYQADLEHDGLVVFSEVWYPGWRAWVDDQEVPILRADGALRAAIVPAGNHHIRMVYDPMSLRVGGILSGLGVFSLVTLGVVETRRRKVHDSCE